MENYITRQASGELRATDKESRKVTFVASDSTRDSAGTVLNQDGWALDRFNKNGIIGYQHKVYGGWDDTENPDNVIGKGHAYVEDHKLMVDVEFEPADINPLAEKIYQKVLFGSLRAVSVGFVPRGKGQWGKGEEALDGKTPTYYFAGQELLEISVVNIPANPNALKKSIEAEQEWMEALKEETRKAIEQSMEQPDVTVDGESVQLEAQAEMKRNQAIAEAALL